MACPMPILKGKSRPESCVAAIGIEVPTLASRSPDCALHSLLHFCVECFLYFWSYLDCPQISPIHGAQAVQDVVELGLDHIDHGIVTKASVWPNELDEIG